MKWWSELVILDDQILNHQKIKMTARSNWTNYLTRFASLARGLQKE
jgi:hypothetical protein